MYHFYAADVIEASMFTYVIAGTGQTCRFHLLIPDMTER